jgi:hypothetical protein
VPVNELNVALLIRGSSFRRMSVHICTKDKDATVS